MRLAPKGQTRLVARFLASQPPEGVSLGWRQETEQMSSAELQEWRKQLQLHATEEPLERELPLDADSTEPLAEVCTHCPGTPGAPNSRGEGNQPLTDRSPSTEFGVRSAGGQTTAGGCRRKQGKGDCSFVPAVCLSVSSALPGRAMPAHRQHLRNKLDCDSIGTSPPVTPKSSSASTSVSPS